MTRAALPGLSLPDPRHKKNWACSSMQTHLSNQADTAFSGSEINCLQSKNGSLGELLGKNCSNGHKGIGKHGQSGFHFPLQAILQKHLWIPSHVAETLVNTEFENRFVMCELETAAVISSTSDEVLAHLIHKNSIHFWLSWQLRHWHHSKKQAAFLICIGTQFALRHQDIVEAWCVFWMHMVCFWWCRMWHSLSHSEISGASKQKEQSHHMKNSVWPRKIFVPPPDLLAMWTHRLCQTASWLHRTFHLMEGET